MCLHGIPYIRVFIFPVSNPKQPNQTNPKQQPTPTNNKRHSLYTFCVWLVLEDFIIVLLFPIGVFVCGVLCCGVDSTEVLYALYMRNAELARRHPLTPLPHEKMTINNSISYEYVGVFGVIWL